MSPLKIIFRMADIEDRLAERARWKAREEAWRTECFVNEEAYDYREMASDEALRNEQKHVGACEPVEVPVHLMNSPFSTGRSVGAP